MRRMARSVAGLAVRVRLLPSSTLRGRLHPGARATRSARLARSARALGHGLRTGRRLPGGTHLLYRIRSGRVAWVAAITAFDARRASRIRSDVRAAGLR